MELRAYWKILFRRWWLVVVPVLVVAVYAFATYAPSPPTYQVVMRFATGTQPAGLSQDYDRFYSWRASEYIAGGLADVAETGAFGEAIGARLTERGLEGVRPAIVTDYTRSILVLYVHWHDAEQLVAAAEAITAEMVENSATYFPQLEGIEPAVRLLDTPVPDSVAPGLRAQLMGPAVKIGLAAGIGIALSLLWHYLDPTVREAAELEEVGLDVLAEIPRRRRRKSQ
jgi:capsular polysaccharide biosynthesis protein